MLHRMECRIMYEQNDLLYAHSQQLAYTKITVEIQRGRR